MLQEEKQNHLRFIMEHIRTASALQQIQTDGGGTPVNYGFLDANAAFEKMWGLSRKEIAGKNLTEVMEKVAPEIDWFEVYNRAFSTGETVELFVPALESGCEVAVCPLKMGYLFVFFHEVGTEEETELLKKSRELTCLYNLHLVSKEKHSLERILKDAVAILPYGFQFPQRVGVNILLRGLRWSSGNFRHTPWMIESDIKIYDEKAGQISVYYTQPPPTELSSFSQEEKLMLDTFAEHLGSTVEYKWLKEELKSSEQRYRSLVESANEAIFVAQNERVKYANSKAEELLGCRGHEILSHPFTAFVHPDDRNIVRDLHWKRMKGSSPPKRYSFRVLTKDGETRWVETSTVLIDWEEHPATLNFLTDITERKQAEESLSEYQQLLQSTIDSLDAHICVLNEAGEIILYNRSWEHFAAENAGKLHKAGKGVNYINICEKAQGEDRPTALQFAEGIRAVMRGEKDRFELEYSCHSPAEKRWFVGRVTPYFTCGQRLRKVVIAHENITRLKQSEEQLNYLNLHDKLTGLYNRTYFQKEMQRLKNIYPTTVITVDLDGLKLVNDTMGPQTGDELLQACAEVLQESLRSEDILARVGGDEFAVLLPGMSEKNGEKVVNRIFLNADLHNRNRPQLPLSISIGQATATGEKDTLEKAYKKADDLMCRNKLHKATGKRAQVTSALMAAMKERDYET